MQRSTRRGFIGTALGAGVGANLLVPYARVASAQEGPPRGGSAPERDPNFVMGKIIDVADDGGLSILDDTDSVRHVRRDGATRAWKASEFNVVEPAAGDCVYARGVPDEEGVLVLETLWANITKLEGDLQSVDAKSKELRLAKKGRGGRSEGVIELNLKDDTIVRGDDGRESSGNADKLKKNSPVVIIGYGDPATRELTAHRVEAFETFGASDSDGKAARHRKARAATHFSIARRGNASFFCCGNVSGCGWSCGSSGGGYCGNCRSSSNHIAWPQVSSCGPYCSGCCLESGYPRYGCGTRFYCENACSRLTTIVTITDCGPTVRCRNTGCQGYDSVRFDLTPCAFSAIGGSFSIGHANVWLSAPI
jgi:hypothetical protein